MANASCSIFIGWNFVGNPQPMARLHLAWSAQKLYPVLFWHGNCQVHDFHWLKFRWKFSANGEVALGVVRPKTIPGIILAWQMSRALCRGRCTSWEENYWDGQWTTCPWTHVLLEKCDHTPQIMLLLSLQCGGWGMRYERLGKFTSFHILSEVWHSTE